MKLALACLLAFPAAALAAQHGPVFGYATPVNSQGEASFDTGLIIRYCPAGSQLTSSSVFGYGITPHITVNAVVPFTFSKNTLPETRISGGGEFAASASWRFQHSVTSVGKRIESTATLGLIVPGPQSDSGVLANLHRAPGIAATVASGFASRSQYLWFGGGYTRFMELQHDRRPDTISFSTVYGYRPAKLRRTYDQWDYRGFAELTGEHTGNVIAAGLRIPATSTTTLWLGPSVLAIFKNVAVEGGIQGPLFRNVPQQTYGRESLRIAINISYLKYSAHTSTH